MKICYFSLAFAFVFSTSALAQSKVDITDIPGYLKFQFESANDPISLDDFPNAIKPDFVLTCALWWSNNWTNITMVKHAITNSRGYKPMGPLFPENPPVETLDVRMVFANGTNKSRNYFEELAANSKTTVTDREIAFAYSDHKTTLRKSGPYIFFNYKENQDAYGYCWREKN